MPTKVALVTGAGSGIGRSAAETFASAGYSVAVADLDEQNGAETAQTINSAAGSAIFIQCDVSDESSVKHLVDQTLLEFGRLDAAFNNAGIEGAQANTAEATSENFDRVIAVNLRGVWLCMREELKHMAQQGAGAIVNCSSVAGLIGLPGIGAYAASKHGVLGLTKTAALEYAKRNIRVNAICPGAIETPMLERYLSNTPGAREAMTAIEPVGRFGRPEEVAEAAVWLCGDASFVTGAALTVDGGWTAS
jgi:NAD(P)-dependent dehydrogenase (short-subunit alcohol dehydrogenase family)